MQSKNIIVEKSFEFSLNIIRFCEQLQAERKYIIANQLLRCGTSVGANVFESQHAESKADFVHKMKIAAKEANETFYWLMLCEKSSGYPSEPGLKLMIEEIIKILSKIIFSSKQ